MACDVMSDQPISRGYARTRTIVVNLHDIPEELIVAHAEQRRLEHFC